MVLRRTGLTVYIPEAHFFPRDRRPDVVEKDLISFPNTRTPSGPGTRVEWTKYNLVRVAEGRSGGRFCCAQSGSVFVEGLMGERRRRGQEKPNNSAPD